jgi:hypothetical protein
MLTDGFVRYGQKECGIMIADFGIIRQGVRPNQLNLKEFY